MATSTASAASYAALVGKAFNSPEVSGFLRANACSVSGSHYLCYAAGIELAVDGANRVILAILNRARGDWTQYRGPLPGSIAWGDTRSTVDEKLGPPVAVHAGLNGIRAWAEYQGGQVTITYDVANGDPGPGATIFDVRVK